MAGALTYAEAVGEEDADVTGPIAPVPTIGVKSARQALVEDEADRAVKRHAAGEADENLKQMLDDIDDMLAFFDQLAAATPDRREKLILAGEMLGRARFKELVSRNGSG